MPLKFSESQATIQCPQDQKLERLTFVAGNRSMNVNG